MKNFRLLFALSGWLITLITSLATFFEIVFEIRYIINGVMFISFFMAIKKVQKHLKSKKDFNFYKIAFERISIPFKILVITSVVYMFFSFILFGFQEKGSPKIINKKYYLTHKSISKKEVTKEVYWTQYSIQHRLSTSHPLGFLAISLLFLKGFNEDELE